MYIQVFDNGYVTDEVSTVPASQSNTNEEKRIKFVTDCAAISRGKTESNNPEKRYKHLLKEAAPNSCDSGCEGVAGRPLEFLPIVLDGNNLELTESQLLEITRFSYLDRENQIIYTNARALLNADVPYEKLPFNTEEELKNFKVVRVKAPYFVFAQIRTHCMISQVAASARVIEETEIWLPNDFKERLCDAWDDVIDNHYLTYNTPNLFNTPDELINSIKKSWYKWTTEEIQMLMRKLGYKREIWQRYPQHALYKTWVMAGWMNDPHIWEHFFLERGVFEKKYKNWVQPETQQIAKAIYEVLNIS